MWNLTRLVDGSWKDVEYFDTVDEAREFIRKRSTFPGSGNGWALVDHSCGEELHADSLAELLRLIPW